MRLSTAEKVYLALRDLEPRLEMDEDLRRRALVPIDGCGP
jgi:quinolinate synthase